MRKRNGLTLLECIVAAGLLVVAVAASGKLSMSAGRIWQQSRYHRLALEELSNQLEVLRAVPATERDEQLQTLRLSELTEQTLPNPSLQGKVIDDDLGQRIKLTLQWDRFQERASLDLVGWVMPPASSTSPAGEEQ